jgi:hypothetical protein
MEVGDVRDLEHEIDLTLIEGGASLRDLASDEFSVNTAISGRFSSSVRSSNGSMRESET